MKEGNVEVNIYIQNIKSFLTKNTEVAEYFFTKEGINDFYDFLTEVAQENFDNYGDPALSIDQFENIREKIKNKYNSPYNPIIYTFFSLN